MNTHEEIKRIYDLKKSEILRRLKEFEQVWLNGNDEEIFTELAFCIFTPQSKAKLCWDTIVKLREKGLLLKGDVEQIEKELHGVRFKNKKARYLVSSREFFTSNGKVCMKPVLNKFNDIYERRVWLVENINGLGYKEASHFLRNIGYGEKIAILDRHILKNLKLLGVIEEIPSSLSRKKYFEIEKKMKEFAGRVKIPMSHLDLVLWYKEAGRIFK
jgi:N-glycosylase/DNA lyase